MVVIFFRTIVIYLLLIGTMRLMGKRQIGELELSELVTTLLLSEIASLPITNHDIPIMFAVIPIVTLLSLEVFMSVLQLKFPTLKNLVSPRPNPVIIRGAICQKELRKLRISNDELLCELRRNGVFDLSEVYYAIVEENGKLTVIPRSGSRQPTTSQLGLTICESGIPHILISDGHIDKHGIEMVGLTRQKIDLYLSQNGCASSEVFLLLCDDAGKYTLILKEKKQ